MKTLNLITLTFLAVLSSCNFGGRTSGEKVSFGIHEVVNINDIPKSIIDTLKALNVQFENNPQLSILGYVQKTDSSFLRLDTSSDSIKLAKTLYPVDKDHQFYVIVAAKLNPAINNSDIKNSKNNSNQVEIYFNRKGAVKWADLTKKNIGKTLVFIIDNQIYAMPVINGEIRNGAAVINGLENEAFSKYISESLNLSRSE